MHCINVRIYIKPKIHTHVCYFHDNKADARSRGVVFSEEQWMLCAEACGQQRACRSPLPVPKTNRGPLNTEATKNLQEAVRPDTHVVRGTQKRKRQTEIGKVSSTKRGKKYDRNRKIKARKQKNNSKNICLGIVTRLRAAQRIRTLKRFRTIKR